MTPTPTKPKISIHSKGKSLDAHVANALFYGIDLLYIDFLGQSSVSGILANIRLSSVNNVAMQIVDGHNSWKVSIPHVKDDFGIDSNLVSKLHSLKVGTSHYQAVAISQVLIEDEPYKDSYWGISFGDDTQFVEDFKQRFASLFPIPYLPEHIPSLLERLRAKRLVNVFPGLFATEEPVNGFRITNDEEAISQTYSELLKEEGMPQYVIAQFKEIHNE